MQTKQILIAALFCCLPLAAVAQYHSQVWNPDLGNGQYKNPVLYADYSDPDVCAVGDDYYLTASSFNCIPGLPILHSKDLVNWEIIGYALQEQEPKAVFDKAQHGKGVWAPSIRYHNGEYYIYWGDPDYGVMMVKAKDPHGPWSKPLCVIAGKGMIDTCPLWDDDGRCYLVNGWAGSRAGFNSVLSMRELSADGTQAISTPRIVFDGGQTNHTTEGPKLYKRNGWYWIMCPAGGVEQGWQLAMRSRSVWGPYEAKKVMAEGKSGINGPHQGGWVHTAQGEDWFLHFNDKEAYGRVVMLQPVTWKDNWPVMGRVPAKGYCGEPYASFHKPKSTSTTKVNPEESDEFNHGEMGLQWQWHANYDQSFGMPTANGTMRLYNYYEPTDYKSLWDVPNLLLQKLPAPAFTATTKVRVAAKADGQYSGIVMMGMDYQALVARRQGDQFSIELHNCSKADRGSSETVQQLTMVKPTGKDQLPYQPAIYLDLYLQMKVKDGKCQMAYSLDGKSYHFAGSPFTMVKGKWIGAKMGYVSEWNAQKGNRGWLDADWFRVAP